MGRHHAGRNVCYTKTTYNTGTAQMTTYKSMVLHKKRLPRVASIALGGIVSLAITFALLGQEVPPPEEPAVAVIVPASVTHQPEQVVEPPVLTPPPSPARLVRPRPSVVVSRPLPTRVWPDVGRHGKHRRLNPKDLDHDGDAK